MSAGLTFYRFSCTISIPTQAGIINKNKEKQQQIHYVEQKRGLKASRKKRRTSLSDLYSLHGFFLLILCSDESHCLAYM